MKNKQTFAFSLVAAATVLSVFGAGPAYVDPYSGEFLADRRKEKGKLVIANCQTAAKRAWLVNATTLLADELKIGYEVKDGCTFAFPKPQTQGEATVFVVDDPALPPSLVAPEARWSLVNVSGLKDKKQSKFEIRTVKGVLRGIIPVLGGMDSQYPKCLMGVVNTVRDLDDFPSLQLPVDVLSRMRNNVKKLGFVPYETITYRQACERGIACQPTNDIQKAIWEDVNAAPQNPIKIKYDPKKGK